ncbi:type III secretion effector protein [Pseudomonas sp. MPB26]|uniref:type III secretion effector protein n=1 Tax=Pseudomonas sp. MPB26 TaxID=3388491 RepID=UPI0039847CF9
MFNLLEKFMSVSTLDSSLSASTTADLTQNHAKPQASASGSAPAAPSFNGQSASVNFSTRDHQAGPVFGGSAATVQPQNATQQAPVLPSFLEQARHWLGHWFGGHRPHPHPGCSNPPPRPNPDCSGPPPRPNPGNSAPARPTPTPGRPFPTLPWGPDKHYSQKNNEQLAQQLLANFAAFKDSNNPGSVSVDSLHAMANRGLSGNAAMDNNIKLARELLRRPELIDAIDRHPTTGALDGLIDRKKLSTIINGDNYFKYSSDKQLAQEMLEHFKELKGNKWGSNLRIADLKKLAGSSLTGDSSRDHLIQLAQEVLKRSDLVSKLDTFAGADNDGRISWKALYSTSR